MVTNYYNPALTAFVDSHGERHFVEFAAKNRLPAIYQSAFFVEAGGADGVGAEPGGTVSHRRTLC
jgi:hypothetical protein